MNIGKIQPIAFQGVRVFPGGVEYVEKYEGDTGIEVLNNAIRDLEDTKWKLNVSRQGYSLTSPTTNRTYIGPFTVKKNYRADAKKQTSPRIIVRMDKNNRVKFPVSMSSKLDVINIYRKIKQSTGLKQLVLLLSVLEKRRIL